MHLSTFGVAAPAKGLQNFFQPWNTNQNTRYITAVLSEFQHKMKRRNLGGSCVMSLAYFWFVRCNTVLSSCVFREVWLCLLYPEGAHWPTVGTGTCLTTTHYRNWPMLQHSQMALDSFNHTAALSTYYCIVPVVPLWIHHFSNGTLANLSARDPQ